MENIALMSIGKANQTISSRQVAEATGKRHDHVIRDIKDLIEKGAIDCITDHTPNLGADNEEPFCIEGSYIAGTGKAYPEYLLNEFAANVLASSYDPVISRKLLKLIRELKKAIENKPLDFSDPNTVLQLAQNWAESERKAKELAQQNERLAIQNEYQSKALIEVKPKVEYYNQVIQSESLITTTVIAKEMGMSAKTLNQILHKQQVIYLVGETWVLYHRYQNKGYTGTKTSIYKDSTGKDKTSVLMCWTEKGREFIHKLIEEYRSIKA